jgi:hypothetical protein
VSDQVYIRRDDPLIIDPPLRGAGWLSANGLNGKEHRRALITVNGKVRIAQRFAIDFVKLGSNGLAVQGDPTLNANWYGYGAEVVAVADATVADIREGIPDNIALTEERAIPITLDTIGGNYVTLKLEGGLFAFYGHLQPSSIKVTVGQRIKKGAVLGHVGNSGNSDAPHLHFQVMDLNSPLGAEGLPYTFRSFRRQGAIGSFEEVIGGKGWQKKVGFTGVTLNSEIPYNNEIVSFQN